jgi:hypothetical protein
MSKLWWLVGALAALLSGCGGGAATPCASNADCEQGGVRGLCLPSPVSALDWCAYDDLRGCDSGKRWGVDVGDGLAESCRRRRSSRGRRRTW